MFKVYVTFKTGDRHLDTDWCDEKKLMQSLYRLIHGPVARLNIIKEIRVVDQDDYTIFLSQEGKQIFPAILTQPQDNNHIIQN